MQIKLLLQLEPPKQEKTKIHREIEESKPSIEEEVRNAIELIDSGHDSYVEWKMLNKLARELQGRKDKRSKDLMKMIDPVLSKYGIYGVPEKGE